MCSKSSSSRNFEKFPFNWSLRLFKKYFENFVKCPGKALLRSFFIANCKAFKFQAPTFFTQHAFSSEELFGKVPGRPTSIVKKNSTLDILLGICRNFRSSYFFKTPIVGCFRKFKQPFSRTPMEVFGWMNRKSQRSKTAQKMNFFH